MAQVLHAAEQRLHPTFGAFSSLNIFDLSDIIYRKHFSANSLGG
jgi:hypothetical protein